MLQTKMRLLFGSHENPSKRKTRRDRRETVSLKVCVYEGSEEGAWGSVAGGENVERRQGWLACWSPQAQSLLLNCDIGRWETRNPWATSAT